MEGAIFIGGLLAFGVLVLAICTIDTSDRTEDLYDQMIKKEDEDD